MSDLRKLNLETFANGAAAELFEAELASIMANVDDVNTKPDLKREITLKFTIQPDVHREQATLTVEAKSKLAPIRDVTSNAYFGRRNGKLVAYSHNVDQLELDVDTKPQAVNEATI